MNKKKVAVISISVLVVITLVESVFAYIIFSNKQSDRAMFSQGENSKGEVTRDREGVDLERISLGSVVKSVLFRDDYAGSEIQGGNLIQNADFSSSWSHWTDAAWNVESNVEIFGGKGVITISDNTDGGDAKLFHDEVAVTPGTYRFGAKVINDVDAKVKLYLKKKNGLDEWRWVGDIVASKNEQNISYESTFSSDVETAVVVILIDAPGSMTVDDYFFIKK